MTKIQVIARIKQHLDAIARGLTVEQEDEQLLKNRPELVNAIKSGLLEKRVDHARSPFRPR